MDAALWGIEMSGGCRFYGRPIFRRAPRSSIVIGKHCRFRSRPTSNLIGINRPCIVATLRENARIRIGEGCGFSGTTIGSAVSIIIGNNVICGANTTITDTDWHHVDPSRRRDPVDVPASPVVFEDNVWLGLNAIVLKGVTIGRNSVIAAGSVVTRSIPANVIAGGVPARVLRPLPDRHP